MLMCFFHNVELEDTSSDKEYYCDSTEPPSKRDAYREARDHKKNTANSVAGDR